MPYSINRYTGTGAPQVLTAPPYLAQSHITVTVNGVVTTGFTWATSSTINITAPANSVIEIRRKSSPNARLVDYTSGGMLTEAILDQDSTQAQYLAQEALDDAADALSAAADAEADGATALAAALAAQATANSKLDTIAVNALIAAQRGAVQGLASLVDGKVPLDQLPPIAAGAIDGGTPSTDYSSTANIDGGTP